MTCDCTQSSGNNSATTTSATNYIATVAGTATVHPARSSGSNGSPGITTPMMMASSSSSPSSGTTNGGCPCAVINTVAGNVGSIVAAAAAAMGGNGATGIGAGPAAGAGININVNAAYGDDATTSNAETLLSSNAKFQAISAIAVTQDGVINVADQGKNKLLSVLYYYIGWLSFGWVCFCVLKFLFYQSMCECICICLIMYMTTSIDGNIALTLVIIKFLNLDFFVSNYIDKEIFVT